LPDQIAATEYLNWIGGDSFSKSRGVGLYCDDALRIMDGELWRFYLLYNRPEGRDVNFSWEELEKAVNGVLISNIANLINRVLSYVQTKYDAVVPSGTVDSEVESAIEAHVFAYQEAMKSGVLSQSVRAVCDLAGFGNEYFQRKAPWATGDDQAVLSAVHFVKAMAVMMLPLMPKFAMSVLDILGIQQPTWDHISSGVAGTRLTDDRVLLERIDIEQIEAAADATMRTPVQVAATPSQEKIAFEEFKRLDLRVARIRDVAEIPGADKLYQLTVDLGDEVRTCVAGIKQHFGEKELIGRSVVVVANLEPTTIRGVRSECMILAAKGDGLALLEPNPSVEPGSVVS